MRESQSRSSSKRLKATQPPRYSGSKLAQVGVKLKMSSIQERLKALPTKSELIDLLPYLKQQEIVEIEALATSIFDQHESLLEQSRDVPLLQWLAENFPAYINKPFAERHLRFWRYIESLKPGVKPPAQIEIWPRGGAKSTSGELGCARIGYKLTRRFILYVSGTQDQADKHVAAVSTLFEKIGLDRALNKYGSSRGWRRNQLRVENGFSLEGIGLDTAARGVKVDENRPGLIIFDDIDSQHDSPKTVEKKIESIQSAIIPAGSSDCAILVLQNLIHEGGVVSQLYDDRADFLLDRETPQISVAIENLKVENVDRGDGRKIWKIVSGVPTWEGQDIETCEKQINEWGLKTFLREAQHEVQGADGFFFDHTQFNIIDEVPDGLSLRCCRAWDLGATQGGGDYTAGVLLARTKKGPLKWIVLDLQHDQLSSNKVRDLIKGTAYKDRNQNGNVAIHLPQDPGQAGKDQAEQYKTLLAEFEPVVEPVSGAKAKRAEGWANEVNSGNVYLIRAEWNHRFIEQHRKFREDDEHEYDDIIDACSDAHTQLSEAPKEIKFTW